MGVNSPTLISHQLGAAAGLLIPCTSVCHSCQGPCRKLWGKEMQGLPQKSASEHFGGGGAPQHLLQVA